MQPTYNFLAVGVAVGGGGGGEVVPVAFISSALRNGRVINKTSPITFIRPFSARRASRGFFSFLFALKSARDSALIIIISPPPPLPRRASGLPRSSRVFNILIFLSFGGGVFFFFFPAGRISYYNGCRCAVTPGVGNYVASSMAN